MRPTERLLQSHGGAGWAGRQRTEGENMLSYISPFQDYPNSPRTFTKQSVTSQKEPQISNNLIQIQHHHKYSPSQTQIHPTLS